MLTTKEVAEKLGVTVRTVTNLVKRGELNASVKFKNSFGYSENDVKNLKKIGKRWKRNQ